MWVKICANTNLADAQAAIDLGADAVGFVFAPSARRVDPEQVRGITAHLVGTAERIGVFQTNNAIEIAGIVRLGGLNGVQLHGDGDPDGDLGWRVRDALGAGYTIVQTLHWTLDGGADQSARLAERVARLRELGAIDRILIDSKAGTALGGTGTSFDWRAGQALFAAGAAVGMPMVVAGGLNPENVAEAIRALGPAGVWGVDVASGVEARRGVKDRERLARFISRARAGAGLAES
jgi:phosphoribosylanthranilate isomerase